MNVGCYIVFALEPFSEFSSQVRASETKNKAIGVKLSRSEEKGLSQLESKIWRSLFATGNNPINTRHIEETSD